MTLLLYAHKKYPLYKKTIITYILKVFYDLVVQWIGHSPAKGEMQVRFLPGSPVRARFLCTRSYNK